MDSKSKKRSLDSPRKEDAKRPRPAVAVVRYTGFLTWPILLDHILGYLEDRKDWFPLVTCSARVYELVVSRLSPRKHIQKAQYTFNLETLCKKYPALLSLSATIVQWTPKFDYIWPVWPSVQRLDFSYLHPALDQARIQVLSDSFPNLRFLTVWYSGRAERLEIGKTGCLPRLEKLTIHGDFEDLVLHKPMRHVFLPSNKDWTVHCTNPDGKGTNRIQTLEVDRKYHDTPGTVHWWGPKPLCVQCDTESLFFIRNVLSDMLIQHGPKPVLRLSIVPPEYWTVQLIVDALLDRWHNSHALSVPTVFSSIVLSFESEESQPTLHTSTYAFRNDPDRLKCIPAESLWFQVGNRKRMRKVTVGCEVIAYTSLRYPTTVSDDLVYGPL